MEALDRILVVCDPAMSSSPALRRGIDLARRAASELHLCLFDYQAAIDLVDPGVAHRAREHFLGERRRWLEQQVTELVGEGLRVKCDAIWAPNLDEAIVAKALTVRPDLVVKDATTQGTLARFVLLPRDWKLVRFCPVPLMLVGSGSSMLPRRIIAGVDAWEDHPEPSPLNAAVIEASLRIGRYCDAEVHVASSMPVIPTTGSTYRHLAHAAAETQHAFARSFDVLTHQFQVPRERTHLLVGDPAMAIDTLASRTSAQLIVVGTHFRSGLERLFLGSTAEALLNLTQRDVLLVKPAGVLREITRHLGIPTAGSDARPRPGADTNQHRDGGLR